MLMAPVRRTIPTHVGRTGRQWPRCVASTGPSPRTWGERCHVSHARRRTADHPHARGENPSRMPIGDRAARTIPTHVGRTHAARRSTRSQAGPSPRTWGERIAHASTATPIGGPSPRTWGERRERRPAMPQLPDHPHARGENALDRGRWSTMTGPSPRTWGERMPIGARSCAVHGPSPRTWGEPAVAAASAMQRRTIPTHVGRT